MSAGLAWLNVAAVLQDQAGAIHALRGRRAGAPAAVAREAAGRKARGEKSAAERWPMRNAIYSRRKSRFDRAPIRQQWEQKQ